MGLKEKWSNYKKSRDEKRIASNSKLITKPKAMKEDRVAAIEYFASHKEPEVAVPALLLRFEYSLEHGINDQREKEKAMDGIVTHGSAAIPMLREHIKNTSHIAWPIKILNKVSEEKEIVSVLLDALDKGDVAFDQAKVEKNFDILCYLADYQFNSAGKHLETFLKDHDERVRFAAVEVLREQNDDYIPNLLEPFLLDNSEENIRIRRAVCETYASKGWKVENKEAIGSGLALPGGLIKADGSVEARS